MALCAGASELVQLPLAAPAGQCHKFQRPASHGLHLLPALWPATPRCAHSRRLHRKASLPHTRIHSSQRGLDSEGLDERVKPPEFGSVEIGDSFPQFHGNRNPHPRTSLETVFNTVFTMTMELSLRKIWNQDNVDCEPMQFRSGGKGPYGSRAWPRTELLRTQTKRARKVGLLRGLGMACACHGPVPTPFQEPFLSYPMGRPELGLQGRRLQGPHQSVPEEIKRKRPQQLRRQALEPGCLALNPSFPVHKLGPRASYATSQSLGPLIYKRGTILGLL